MPSKNIAEEEILVLTGGRGLKNIFISSSRRGCLLMKGVIKIFLSNVLQFCVTVSTQFVAFLDALQHRNLLFIEHELNLK